MNREQARQLLGDYLDGSLPADHREALVDCLRQDPELQQELTQLQALLEQAAKIPRKVEPDRDLWPEISAAIVKSGDQLPGHDVAARPAQRRARWFPTTRSRLTRQWRPLLAAAAVLTLVFLATRLPEVDSRSRDVAGGRDWQELDLQANGARTMLNALELECAPRQKPAVSHLDSPDEPLSVSSRGIMAHNQRIVDLAMADISAAWAANPHDPLLTSLLTKLYRTKADLQSRTVELATQI